jgi:carboxylesterase
MTTYLTIPTAEPFFIPGGKIGCLLIHGFTGTPKEMRMLADSLSLEKYTILGVRLAGHATDLEDMGHSTWRDWLASVEDGLNILRGCTDRQVVMGLSMGGVLSMMAAARFNIKGVITFSAPCGLPADPRAKFLPYFSWLIPQISKGKPDWHNLEAMEDHVDYPGFPTRSVLQLQQLIGVMKEELPQVKVPALMIQSHGDHSIPAESMDTLYDNISSTDKTRLWVENSGHVVIREPERELIFSEVKKFIKRITQ